MRRLLFSGIALFFALALAAQEETLFGRNASVGGFGGPILEFASVRDQFGVGVGGGGGVIVDGFFMGGFGLGGSYEQVDADGRLRDLGYGYGGLWLGLAYPSDKVIHLHTSLKIGWGSVSLKDVPFPGLERESDNFFALVPEAGLELNVFSWFRIGGSVGYRWFNGLSGPADIGSDDFNGLMGGLVFRFGGFGHQHRGDRY